MTAKNKNDPMVLLSDENGDQHWSKYDDGVDDKFQIPADGDCIVMTDGLGKLAWVKWEHRDKHRLRIEVEIIEEERRTKPSSSCTGNR